MVITYHGGHFVKIAQGETVIGVNPFGKGSSKKPIRFGARLGLVSMDHPDMNGVENLTYGEKAPFVISGPGEYEVGGIAVFGFLAPKPVGEKKLLNTIYTLELEGIRLCFLGALASPELSPELVEGIGEVDILFAPVPDGELLSPQDAEKIMLALEAKLMIPLGWDDGGEKYLKQFLKEAGAEKTDRVEKLTLKRKDLDGKEGDVVILEPLARA